MFDTAVSDRTTAVCNRGHFCVRGAGTLRANPDGAMLELAFALLDVRRVIHVALVALVLAGIHLFGSPGLQSEVDRLVVNPISRTASVLLEYPLEAVRSVSGLVSTSTDASDPSR